MACTFLYEFAGRVMVFVGSSLIPASTEWDEHITALRVHCKNHPDVRAVIWGGGAQLTPRQRKQVGDTIPKGARVAVVASGAVDRGIVTAIGWFVDGIRAFSPEHELETILHLNLLPEEAKTVLAVSRRLRDELARRTAQTG